MRRAIAHFLQKYPSIKILGHNQIDKRHCPNMNVEYLCGLLGVPRENMYQKHHFPAFSRQGLPMQHTIIEKLESGEEYSEDVVLDFENLYFN